ncbi:hypothetical protein [Paenibacillus sp. Soil750]|uniref:hypothetical protein n=1 Tax=Paenibacillus sp. Soil750 TaxID=1736398 RepID=UPI0006FB17F7|nr:hypothetical protein [Paenibacillus sp. Soil750]KRE70766.1 hypothetical protein ASL11_10755 [Paenibacillus sp. Soil750]
MARKKKDYGFKLFEKSTSADNRHIRITLDMMDSKAWKELTAHSRMLYMEMKAKYTGSNQNDISFTYKEALKIMNDRTFTKCIDQLIEYGFIKLLQQNWTKREPNIYGFSEQWKFFGTSKLDVQVRKKRVPSTKEEL